eukprot:1189614-Prorocentrum_minimum.AAC.2
MEDGTKRHIFVPRKRGTEEVDVHAEWPPPPPERLEEVLQTRWPSETRALLTLMRLEVNQDLFSHSSLFVLLGQSIVSTPWLTSPFAAVADSVSDIGDGLFHPVLPLSSPLFPSLPLSHRGRERSTLQIEKETMMAMPKLKNEA